MLYVYTVVFVVYKIKRFFAGLLDDFSC